MRLIDGDTLKERFEMLAYDDWNQGTGTTWARAFEESADVVECAPTIDAVEVVRCKDCKHWHREIHDGIEYFNFNSCDLNHYGDGHNFYCADGERRGEDE